MTYQERTRWFQQARFGMFIHWGLYALPGLGEWLMYVERIPPEEYADLAKRFRPPKSFRVESWIRTARDAGMRYAVLTSRHHDGFCLFDSKVSGFTSAKTAAGRDFVAEFVEACRKYRMKVGLYYSLLDWRFPGWHRGPEKDPSGFAEMVDQAHAQVRELMTRYGRIDVLWYDGGWIPRTDARDIAKWWKSAELNRMVRSLQPHIIINNRSGLDEDLDTPEQHVTASAPGRCWESCVTIGSWWGYVRRDPNLKSVANLIQELVTAASGAGNYLLNVGPGPNGSIQPQFVSRLRAMGAWMSRNSDSIYGSQRCPSGFGSSMFGKVTAKDNNAYLHIFRWPGQTATLVGIENRVLSARFLATGRPVAFRKTRDGKLILRNLPPDPPDPYDTVVKIALEGNPLSHPYEGIPL